MRRPLLAAALLALAVAAAGCAIPTQGAPSSIARSKVPFNLMDPHPPTTTTSQPANFATFVPVKVYFLDTADHLVEAGRVVPPPAPLIAIIRALLSGPTASETTNDITTAIPSNVKVLSVAQQPGNIVMVNLNGAFGEITGVNTQLAVGQIVATVVNEVGPGTGVVFEIEGQRISVPIANGSLVAGPVYLLDFLTPPT
ncbi:MAG TPA: GerMN domain-containing protein [Acidimicrobiales bacterium]|nr:GerMN domain-containing protein [Acidimicrobiales bacterium]